MASRNILLLEPPYPNKYPPLGLMKLASHHRQHDNVLFLKSEDPRVLTREWHRIYVTTLFTFEWARTAKTIDFAIRAAAGNPRRVWVGGIAASLMHDTFTSEPKWKGVRFIKGLLEHHPAEALQLTESEILPQESHASAPPIEEQTPDYGILKDITHRYPVQDAYFGYASRGCIRKCSFCGVPALEGDLRDSPPITTLVGNIDAAHGVKKDLILMDNNVVASPRYREIIAEIRDLGFIPGAKLQRPGNRPVARRVDFNQGVDARILAKSPMYLREMATIAISPLRIAFDHIGLAKVYDKSVRSAAQHGITRCSNYMLYNFMDSPEDLYKRMKLNIELNEELGINIWSFPMRYQPVNMKDRSHVGKHWHRYTLRSMQVILQATRGVVTGNPSFFNMAYGDSGEKFIDLLKMPHAFIFHRQYFQDGPGQSLRLDYEAMRNRLSDSQRDELLHLLSETPSNGRPHGEYLRTLAADSTIDNLVRKTLRYHILDTKDRAKYNSGQLLESFDPPLLPEHMPTSEEMVEDAGLTEPILP